MKLRLVPSTHCLLQSLPLKSEPLSAVCGTSDLIEFVEYYSICYGQDELELFREYVQKFGVVKTAEEIYNATSYSSGESLSRLGGTLKHAFAFDRTLTVLTGFDNVNALGLPYLLEAAVDLDSAIELLAMRRYKLSTQVLRSSLEAAVAHAYFSTTGLTYESLEKLQPKLPSMNDRKRGMLSHLTAFKVLTQVEAQKIASAYRCLNAAVHSQFQYLEMRFEEFSHADFFSRTLKHIEEVSILCLVVMLNMQRMRIHGPINIAPLYATKTY